MTAWIDRGQGPVLVLIPAIQGPWEYLSPAVDALAQNFHVLAWSLGGSPDGTQGVDAEVEQVKAILDAARIERAIICGVSYGGVVATAFAAKHPMRTAALVVASAPGAGWHLKPRHAFYARWPLVFGPAFFAESPFRIRRELAAALPTLSERWKFARWQLATLVKAPFSLTKMAARAVGLGSHDVVADCRRVTAPTLVVTGEAALDRVVPVGSTATYVECIAGAQSIVLDHTGHFGTITRPAAFTAMVSAFVSRAGVAPAFGRTEVA